VSLVEVFEGSWHGGRVWAALATWALLLPVRTAHEVRTSALRQTSDVFLCVLLTMSTDEEYPGQRLRNVLSLRVDVASFYPEDLALNPGPHKQCCSTEFHLGTSRA
jgi:hypothetical protein